MKPHETEFGVTIKPTDKPGVWKVTGKVQGRKRTVRLVQPIFEVQIGIEPTIDQAINALLNARDF
jgi:hypothetical protein